MRIVQIGESKVRMSLTRQIHLYSIATDSFYEPDEQYIHKRLLKLYKLRQKTTEKWKKASINRVIAKEKNKLSEILNNRLEDKIVRQLNPEAIKDKNVVSLFESSLTRALGIQTNELTDKIMIINVFFFQVFEDLVKRGFEYNGEKYIFLTASAGQIRTKRAVFVKEKDYTLVQSKLMCGLTIEHINEKGGINPNKFLAYLALNNSATDVWENFDIDKSIVVEDFEAPVHGEVDFIDDVTYEIERREMDINIAHMDGAGIMLDGPTRMCRLPWVKGLMIYFPFDEFIKEKCSDGKTIVTDIYGQDHDILAEDIRYIFTKSQFKLYKYYDSWEEYKQKFKENQCEACYCNLEEADRPPARINYQMLQTLSDITDDEIQRLVKKSVKEIEAIGEDYQTTMRLLGATEYNMNPSYFQQGLMIYPELFRDNYCRDVLKQTKKSLVKQAKAGRLRVNGRYRFVSPDLYAFCEWLFLDEVNPQGLLKDGEVYVGDFQDGDELACLRSPHLYREWPIRKNKKNEELDRWFRETKCVYTSCHDLISRILQFDNDGDTLLVIRDKLLTKVAKRNMKGIVPLFYEMKKAKGGLLNPDSLYSGMTQAYTTGNIGPISNNITKIWNCGETEEQEINVIKWLCMENNFVIDAAKTLYTPTRPPKIDKIIKSYTKANPPQFFIYAKDKLPSQVELANNSAMNRIMNAIPSSRIKFNKSIGRFDYRMLMNQDVEYEVFEDNPVIKSYEYWNTHQYLFNSGENAHANQEDLYIYQKIRENILTESGKDIDYVVNTLVAYLYTVCPTSTKKVLWSSFGDVIVKNLQNNIPKDTTICPICGKRFVPERKWGKYCSEDCRQKAERILDKNRKKSGASFG